MNTTQVTLFLALALMLISCSDSGTDPDPTFYDVSVSVAPEDGGTITPAADSSYEAGSQINLQATPADGFQFTGWSGDVESSENPLSLTIDKDYSLAANFTKETLFNVSVSVTPEGAGTIAPAVDSAYTEGSTIDLLANAAEGFQFEGWSGDVKSTDNPLSLTIDQAYSLNANFIDTDQLFVLAGNGVTIRCPQAEVGQTGMVDGTEYEAVDRDLLDQKFADGADLTTVCTTPVSNLAGMFFGAEDFNQNISSWDVSNVTNMRGMFAAGLSGEPPLIFNRDISHWDVSSVTDMSRMFNGAEAFNRDIGSWDVSSVTDMSNMFYEADSFDQDLNDWDVGSVTDMSLMFAGDRAHGDSKFTSFNGNISDWDVSSVTDMSSMFSNAENFNQDLSGWCVQNISEEPSGFSARSPLSEAHHPIWGTCPE